LARRAPIVLALAALACACGPSSSKPTLTPLEPTAAVRRDATSSPTVELARPEDPTSGAKVASTGNGAPGVTGASGASVTPMASGAAADEVFKQLGPIHVIGFDEAKNAADQQIDKTNAEAELQKLKGDLRVDKKGGG
jgi:hypothetical protein